ncbi:Hypothetical predicted protein [Octopus vulgaris]|uniref:Uncharacterized protein n=1 Tax=Octopus vulgaris TaxID=6645 RepID=A0AA36FBI2_OCTVU|nr:Hypothetical predicted protein [Octopus vulgaris]
MDYNFNETIDLSLSVFLLDFILDSYSLLLFRVKLLMLLMMLLLDNSDQPNKVEVLGGEKCAHIKYWNAVESGLPIPFLEKYGQLVNAEMNLRSGGVSMDTQVLNSLNDQTAIPEYSPVYCVEDMKFPKSEKYSVHSTEMIIGVQGRSPGDHFQ